MITPFEVYTAAEPQHHAITITVGLAVAPDHADVPAEESRRFDAIDPACIQHLRSLGDDLRTAASALADANGPTNQTFQRSFKLLDLTVSVRLRLYYDYRSYHPGAFGEYVERLFVQFEHGLTHDRPDVFAQPKRRFRYAALMRLPEPGLELGCDIRRCFEQAAAAAKYDFEATPSYPPLAMPYGAIDVIKVSDHVQLSNARWDEPLRSRGMYFAYRLVSRPCGPDCPFDHVALIDRLVLHGKLPGIRSDI